MSRATCVEEGRRARLLLEALEGQHELLPGVGFPGVLPGQLLAPRDEAVDRVAAALQVVVAARELQAGREAVPEFAAIVDRADARDEPVAEVGRRVLHEVRRRELRAVELLVQAALEEARADAVPGGRRDAELQLAARARMAVAVGIEVAEQVVRPQRRDAVAALARQRRGVVEGAERAAGRHIALARAVAADGRMRAEARARPRRARVKICTTPPTASAP